MTFAKLTIGNEIIDYVEVTITKRHVNILCFLDGMLVEKYNNYRPLINKFHLKDYIEELTEGTDKSEELYTLITSKL